MSLSATRGLNMGGAPVRIKCEVEISAILNYVIVHQLAFSTFVCITQLFLALRYLEEIWMMRTRPKGPKLENLLGLDLNYID